MNLQKQMKRNTNPEKVLRNIRSMIEEAEDAFSQKGKDALDEYQISELKERIEAGLNCLRDYSNGLGERVSSYYSEAEDRLRDYYEHAEDRLRSGVETTDETLRTHPYQMATAAFGLGLVIGALIRSGMSR